MLAALQAELLREQVQRPATVAFQNPAETNQRLVRAGITYASLPTCSMAELRAALGVDALLTGHISMHQLLPGGVSIAVFALSNTNPMADNSVRTYLDVYDTRSGQLVWRFDHELHGKPSVSPVAVARVWCAACGPGFRTRSRKQAFGAAQAGRLGGGAGPALVLVKTPA